MKKTLLSTIVFGLLLVASSRSLADGIDYSFTYLGGTASAADCAALAGSLGYREWAFGGYVGGIYYWNACLARNPAGPIVDPVNPSYGDCRANGGYADHPAGDWYRVYVGDAIHGRDVRNVANQIENHSNYDLRCFTDCEIEQKLHCRDARSQGEDRVKDMVLDVRGVKDVIGSFDRAENTANSY
jgi:hypothetical protein